MLAKALVYMQLYWQKVVLPVLFIPFSEPIYTISLNCICTQRLGRLGLPVQGKQQTLKMQKNPTEKQPVPKKMTIQFHKIKSGRKTEGCVLSLLFYI